MVIRNQGERIDLKEFIENGNGPKDLILALGVDEERMRDGAAYLQLLDPIYDEKIPQEWSTAEFLLGPFDFVAIRPNGDLSFEASSLLEQRQIDAIYDAMDNFSKKDDHYDFFGMKFETVYVVVA